MTTNATPAASGTSTGPPRDFGLEGMVMLAQFHGIAVDSTQLRHQCAATGPTLAESQLLQAARSIGLKARIIDQPLKRLAHISWPAMALVPTGAHFLIAGFDSERVLIHDFALGTPQVMSVSAFAQRYHGRLLVVTARQGLSQAPARFDFSWFIPALVKYRKLLFEVLTVSLILRVLALLTPLMFQVVMDKVLVNRAYGTLNVIARP